MAPDNSNTAGARTRRADELTGEQPLVELDDLTKRFHHRGRDLTVLEDMNLSVYKGDRIAIMGPSGAGKSTLLQVMGTLDDPSSGTVRFDGEDVFTRDEDGLAKFRNREIGFVFQFHHLLPEFTALENVMMPGLISRMNRTEAADRAEELLDMVGLAERLEHQPGELSGGEQQRVAIARALFMKPRLILSDELTGNLDLKTGAGIHAILRDLNERLGVTVVVVTHDPRLAEQMPIKLVVDDGKLLPFEAGDERVRGRIPDHLMDREPSNPKQLRADSDRNIWNEASPSV
jgi:lipoprotein-releasing system ATP-binding protein